MSRRESIDPHWEPRLLAVGVSSLSALLESAPDVAAFPGRWEALVKPGLGTRERWRWKLSESTGDATVYVKRYGPPGLRGQWDRIYRQASRHSRAFWEFERSRELAAANIAAPRAVAFVEEMQGALEQRSAVLLEAVLGEPLDLLWNRLDRSGAAVTRDLARHDFAVRLGRFVAAFHGTGLCHRDLYLCHIFATVDPECRTPPRFAIIDLARTHRPRLLRLRWLIKDLAQLDFSARQAGASRSDRLRVLCAYLGLERTAPRVRWYARKIARKADSIQRREERRAAPKAADVRVAIVNEFVDPRRGGAETSISQMALRLAEGGLDVSVVASDEAPLPAHPRLGLVTIPPPAGPRWLRTRSFLLAARKWCDQHGIDIVHAVTPCERCDVYQPRGGTYRATVEQGLALTANPLRRGARQLGRWFNVRQQMLARVERRMLRSNRPPHVAAISTLVARQIRALAPHFPPERLHVIFNACDVDRQLDWTSEEQSAARQTLGLPPETSLILFIAHNFRLKGLAELIGALADPPLRGTTVELAVVGRDRPGPMAELAKRLCVASRVRFVGPAQSISPWFAAADVLAHPTWYDPCSRVVLEALCHGLPVVTTRCNGAAEIVTPEIGCVIETPRDVAVLAEGIRQCLNTDLRQRAVAASAEMRARLSMRRHAAELLALYETIVKSSAPATD